MSNLTIVKSPIVVMPTSSSSQSRSKAQKADIKHVKNIFFKSNHGLKEQKNKSKQPRSTSNNVGLDLLKNQDQNKITLVESNLKIMDGTTQDSVFTLNTAQSA